MNLQLTLYFFQIYFLTLFCTEKLKSMNEAFREVKNKEKGRELAWCESLQLERVLLLIIYNNYSDLCCSSSNSSSHWSESKQVCVWGVCNSFEVMTPFLLFLCQNVLCCSKEPPSENIFLLINAPWSSRSSSSRLPTCHTCLNCRWRTARRRLKL